MGWLRAAAAGPAWRCYEQLYGKRTWLRRRGQAERRGAAAQLRAALRTAAAPRTSRLAIAEDGRPPQLRIPGGAPAGPALPPRPRSRRRGRRRPH